MMITITKLVLHYLEIGWVKYEFGKRERAVFSGEGGWVGRVRTA